MTFLKSDFLCSLERFISKSLQDRKKLQTNDSRFKIIMVIVSMGGQNVSLSASLTYFSLNDIPTKKNLLCDLIQAFSKSLILIGSRITMSLFLGIFIPMLLLYL